MKSHLAQPADEVSDEERRILEERLKMLDEDAKTAEPWDVVRERLLRKKAGA